MASQKGRVIHSRSAPDRPATGPTAPTRPILAGRAHPGTVLGFLRCGTRGDQQAKAGGRLQARAFGEPHGHAVHSEVQRMNSVREAIVWLDRNWSRLIGWGFGWMLLS